MESLDGKIILSYDAQIEHLKSRGITFKYEFNEEKAKEYLQSHNSFFRLRAYRFDFRDLGTDTYRGLDFSYLVNLARIDDKLRKLILYMSIDMEHFSKIQLLKLITDEYAGEDACELVRQYHDSLNKRERLRLKNIIKCSENSTYVQNLYKKYEIANWDYNFPVQVFLEIIPFGTFTHFYGFCINNIFKSNKKWNSIYNLLLTVKDARNAAAHDNCFVNDLKTENVNPPKADYNMLKLLTLEGVSERERQRKFKNKKVLQIITCFYAYRELVISNPENNYKFLLRPYNAIPEDLRDELYALSIQLGEFIKKLPTSLEAKYSVAKEAFELAKRIVDVWYLEES